MMQYGVSKLVSESHSISPNAHSGSGVNTTARGNRYDTLRKFGFGVDIGELFVLNNDKNELLPAVQG